jgi:hypothetical protein
MIKEELLAPCVAGAFNVRVENWPAVICAGWKLAVTPVGRPDRPNVASCENPLLLANDTWTVAVCPSSKVTELGPVVRLKLEDPTIDSELDDVAVKPSTVTVMGPLAAPDGMTNEIVLPVSLDIGATIVPPPSWFNVTTGENPLCVKPPPCTVTSEPIDVEDGEKLPIVAGTMKIALIDCELVLPARSVACTAMVSAPAVSGTAQL